MIMIIIKLITTKEMTHPHTHRDKPPWLFWVALLGLPWFYLWGVDSIGEYPEPLGSLPWLAAPVVQGGVCVCGVRLVGVWRNNGRDWILELIAPSEDSNPKQRWLFSTSSTRKQKFLRSTFSLCFSAWGSFKQSGWLQLPPILLENVGCLWTE